MIGNNGPETRRWRVIIDVLAVVSALALLVSGWGLYSRFSETNGLRQENKDTWHAVICSIEQGTIKNRTLSFETKKHNIDFFDEILTSKVHAAPCNFQIIIPKK